MQTDTLLTEATGHDEDRDFENRDFIVHSVYQAKLIKKPITKSLTCL